MSKQIADKPASFCPENCTHMSLVIDTDVMYANEKIYQTIITLSCDHEDACKMWADKEQQPPQYIKSPNDIRADCGVPPIEEAYWTVWGGWSGNHDRRIEDATCSNCGYIHPKVYGSLDKLATECPSCKRKITIVRER